MKLNKFIKDKVQRSIDDALNPKGMHTNGPCIAHIEVSMLQRLLLVAESAEESYDDGYSQAIEDYHG